MQEISLIIYLLNAVYFSEGPKKQDQNCEKKKKKQKNKKSWE